MQRALALQNAARPSTSRVQRAGFYRGRPLRVLADRRGTLVLVLVAARGSGSASCSAKAPADHSLAGQSAPPFTSGFERSAVEGAQSQVGKHESQRAEKEQPGGGSERWTNRWPQRFARRIWTFFFEHVAGYMLRLLRRNVRHQRGQAGGEQTRGRPMWRLPTSIETESRTAPPHFARRPSVPRPPAPLSPRTHN